MADESKFTLSSTTPIPASAPAQWESEIVFLLRELFPIELVVEIEVRDARVRC